VAISPMRFKDYLAKKTRLEDATIRDAYGEHILSTQRAIVTRDRFDVHRADALLFNLLGAENVSIGTMIEMGWADDDRKVTVTAMESDSVHDHAFVRELSGFILPTLDEALDVLVAVGRTR